MKKFFMLFAALFALALCSCISFQSAFQKNDDIQLGGVLKANDKNSYFIIVGEESKYAQTFFLVKDAQNADVWKTLVSSVGKTVFVHGKVVEDGGPWLKTVSVEKLSFPNP